MLMKTNFQPGINRESTQYATGFGWYDGDKIRFRMGRVEQIGGWTKYSNNTFIGVARSLHDWSTTSSNKYLGVGTTYKVYVHVETDDTYYDITPIRDEEVLTNPFDITLDSSTIKVNDSGHGAVTGDFVTFSGASTIGGSNITDTVLNQEYQITSVPDLNYYYITAKDASGNEVVSDTTATGAGGSVTAEYQMNSGTNDYTFANGWGYGGWGDVGWGGSDTVSYGGQIRLYSQDTFGDDLIFNPRAGNIYYWDTSAAEAASPAYTDQRAVTLTALAATAGKTGSDGNPVTATSNTGPPVIALQTLVSPIDGHVIALGCNAPGSSAIDPMLIRWSDQSDAAEWVPAVDRTVGLTQLTAGSEIIGGVRTRQEILIFTDTAIYSMRFIGGAFVFQFSLMAENVSMCSPNAAIPAGDSVYFMDTDGFYIYRGAVQRLPCTVLKYVFENIDKSQKYKVFAMNNPDESEVTWFYPSLTLNGQSVSSPAEINSYVTYNYLEDAWSIGTMARGAWIQAASRDYPIASGINLTDESSQYLYNQENGYDADGESMGAYIQSGQFEIQEGDRLAFLKRFIPDIRYAGATADATFTVNIYATDFPQIIPETDDPKATVTLEDDTKQKHIRVRGREAIVRITSNGSGYGWTMGDFRFDMRTDGKR